MTRHAPIPLEKQIRSETWAPSLLSAGNIEGCPLLPAHTDGAIVVVVGTGVELGEHGMAWDGGELG